MSKIVLGESRVQGLRISGYRQHLLSLQASSSPAQFDRFSIWTLGLSELVRDLLRCVSPNLAHPRPRDRRLALRIAEDRHTSTVLSSRTVVAGWTGLRPAPR